MSIELVARRGSSLPALVFCAVQLTLVTRRREQVRRQLSPYLAEAELERVAAVERDRGAARRPCRGAAHAVRVARVDPAPHRSRRRRRPRRGVRLPRRADRVRSVRAPARLEGNGAGGRPAARLRSRRRGSSCTCKGLRRSRAFEQQLPEILDTLAASLRAGHGFDHGLQTVATDVGEPAGREFRRVVAEVHLGRSLEDALAELGRRIRSADLQFVLDAIAIQRQVGGSLAELFELVATTVRAREQFRRNLRAITGQVRISANVLTGLPIVAAVLLTLDQPQLHEPALAHLERAPAGARCSGHGRLRLVRPSARRKGAVVTVLLLVLAALTLSASIFVAVERSHGHGPAPALGRRGRPAVVGGLRRASRRHVARQRRRRWSRGSASG